MPAKSGAYDQRGRPSVGHSGGVGRPAPNTNGGIDSGSWVSHLGIWEGQAPYQPGNSLYLQAGDTFNGNTTLSEPPSEELTVNVTLSPGL